MEKSLGFTLGFITIVVMIWYFVLGQSYGQHTGMDLLQIWKFVTADQGAVYLGLFTWGLVLGFMVIPFATFANGQSSLINILGAAFDNAMDKVSKLGNDSEGSAGTQEEKNAYILSFLIYIFLIVGIYTVLFFFMDTFGHKFLLYAAQTVGVGGSGGGIISGIGFFWDAIKNLIWAYAGLIFLAFVMNIINKNVIQKSLENDKVSGIEFLKSILLILSVIGMSYWAVNALDMAKDSKNVGSVIGIEVQGGTTDDSTFLETP